MTNGEEQAHGFDIRGADPEYGLTKREYFAAMAMQGIIRNNPDQDVRFVGQDAVLYADALINALNQKTT